jgi:hypothetical protein
MDRKKLVKAYLRAWGDADLEALLDTCAPGYVLDDPDGGQVPREGLKDFLAKLRKRVPGGKPPFVENVEVIGDKDWKTAYCWWTIPGSGLTGAGLIKVSKKGILSERVAYYCKLPGRGLARKGRPAHSGAKATARRTRSPR